MTVYLIECGDVMVLYVQERQEYFIVNDHPKYLQQFIQGVMDCAAWQGGKKFVFDNKAFTDNTVDPPKELQLGENIDEEDLLKLFYLPENNPGAVIASRNDKQSEPKIYNKYAFKMIA